MPCWGTAEQKAAILAKYRTDPDKWFQRPEELLHVAFRAYFEEYTITDKCPKSQNIEVYTDARDFCVYRRQKRKKHLVSVRFAAAAVAVANLTFSSVCDSGHSCIPYAQNIYEHCTWSTWLTQRHCAWLPERIIAP